MKRIFVILISFFSASLSIAQTAAEKSLVNYGFENVRQITDKNGREIFFLESKVYHTYQREFDAICTSMDSLSRQLRKNDIDIIVLNNRVPVFRLRSSGYTSDLYPKIRWKSDFNVKESYRALNELTKGKKFYNSSFGKIDLLFYPQLRFKNTSLDRIYLFQININPTLEVSLWKGAKLTSQIIIPIIDDYSQEEGLIRPGYITLSQDFRLPFNIIARATIGNFNQFRAGADLKLFKPIGGHVGLYGQLGATGMSVLLFDKFYYTDINRTTWKVGANCFIKPWNLMFNFNVGQYLANDISARGEIVRYFKNASVGFYLQTIELKDYPVNGGFFFSIALPPYKHKRNKGFRVSTAKYFNLEYLARPYQNEGRMYQTAPDESVTENFFNTMRFNQIINNTN